MTDTILYFLGIGYVFVGLFNSIRSISYPGMGILNFSSFSFSLKAASIAAYLESVTILFSYVLLKDKNKYFKYCAMSYILLAAGSIIILFLFKQNTFPFLTAYKNVSQSILLLIYLLAGVLFYKQRKNIDRNLYIYIVHNIGAKIASIVFYILSSSNDSYNVLLHASKLMAFYFIYKAFIEVGLKAPFRKLYFQLTETSEKLELENEVRKSIEEGVLKNEEVYKLLIENSKDALVVHSDGKIVFANQQAMDLLKIENKEEFFGAPVYNFISEGEREIICDKIMEIYSKKCMIPFFETKLRTRDGRDILVEASGIYLVFNSKPAVAAIVRDLSYKKQVEKLSKDVVESTKLLQESREYNRLITEFIANISHEVRTPLNVILGAIQLMELQNKDSKYLGVVKQNCFRLLRMVNNLIDISKIDSGYFDLTLRN